MSYDLTFLIKVAGQSWEEAFEALGEDASGDLPEGQAWAAVLQHAREMLGEDARRIVQTLYDLGRIVEEHTGLDGYDGQVELPLAEAMGRPDLVAAVFDQVAASFAQRGISSPSNDN